ncbi:hypothetical protein AAMO2058_000475600, partial [Amorphochlora amoebiformis]
MDEKKGIPDDIAQNVIKRQHYTNVLKNVYSSAKESKDEAPGVPMSRRVPNEAEWRLRVGERFNTRKLDQIREKRMQKKLDAMRNANVEVRIPKAFSRFKSSKNYAFKKKKSPSSKRLKKKEGVTKIVYAHPDAEPPSRQKTLRHRREHKQRQIDMSKKMAAAAEKSKNRPSDRVYNLTSTDEELYKLNRDRFDELPLELFDSPENVIHSPQEWLALGESQGGTPAKVKVFKDRKWVWVSGKVTGYESASSKFEVKVAGLVKNLPRLSVMFDAESSEAFQQRVARCRQLRETAYSLRRYTKLIDAQNAKAFAPIEPGRLHGIVERVVQYEEKLVLERKEQMKALLTEIRDDYTVSMKTHIVEYARRTDPEEEKRLFNLRVPPLSSIPPVPHLAVIKLPDERPRYILKKSRYGDSKRAHVGYVITAKDHDIVWIDWLRRKIGTEHHTAFTNTSRVLLHLYRNWHFLKKKLFYNAKDEDKRPWTLYQFHDYQNDVFQLTFKELEQEWRMRIANYMKVQLANTFNLFESEAEVYNKGKLCKFLKMVNMILRDQLATLINDSVSAISSVMAQYNYTSKPAADDDYANFRPKPLLVFKITASKGKVVFMPALSQIEGIIMSMIDIPTRVRSLIMLDSEVVPLLRLPEIPLIGEKSSPHIFQKVKEAKEHAHQIL